MRIISGKFKGRRFSDKGFSARPTTDFAKENLFNVLSNTLDFEGLEVLDLFAGTGSISYEFVSRGAKQVYAIEKNFKHVKLISGNIIDLNIDNLKVWKQDVFKYLSSPNHKVDVIFADPPYDLPKIDIIPDLVFEQEVLNPEGVLILEHSNKYDFSKHAHFSEMRKYGSVHFSMFK